MTERPILFSAPMVRALLSGTKTQTRRIVKPLPELREATVIDGVAHWLKVLSRDVSVSSTVRCPFGAPGDRLWVRETFNLARPITNSEGIVDDESTWIGRMPEKDPREQAFMSKWRVGYAADGCDGRMRPSIHMPRWASRITLEVTGVRVERLQSISEADARAEGIEGHTVTNALTMESDHTWRDYDGGMDPFEWYGNPRDSFRSLWESIDGAGSWALNPWVWVVEFKRVTP